MRRVIITALFPFFCFLQMNALNSISAFMTVGNLYLGTLSAAYIFGDSFLLIPAGIILNKYNAIKVVFFAFSGYLLALFVFSNSSIPTMLIVSRFLMGCFHAFALLSCFNLIAIYLPNKEKTFAISLTIMIALLGGFVAQAPLLLLIHHVGLKFALDIDIIIGMIFLLFMIILWRKEKKDSYYKKTMNLPSIKNGMKYAIGRKVNWYAASYVCILSLPLMILGSVWGVDYLAATARLSAEKASFSSSMLFVGIIIGSPLLGLISYKFSMKALLRYGAIGTLLILLCTIITPIFFNISYTFLFFLLGLISSSQLLGYSLVSQNIDTQYSGISIGMTNALIMFFTACSQFVFGYLTQTDFTKKIIFMGNYFHGLLFIVILLVVLVGITLKQTAKTHDLNSL